MTGAVIPLGKLVRFLDLASGQDKFHRLLVYSLMLLAHARPKSKAAAVAGSLVPVVSQTRVVMRLLGIVPMLAWGQQIPNLGRPRSREELIEQAKFALMMLYYPAEHVWFLGTLKVIPVTDPDAWSRQSCRAWALYVLLDLYSSSRVRTGKRDGEWKVRVTGQVADFILALHWSVRSYPLPPHAVAVLGLISAMYSSWLQWKSTPDPPTKTT